jgi:hypothetical protein
MSPRQSQVNQQYRYPNQESKHYTNIKETIKGKTINQQKETGRTNNIINKKLPTNIGREANNV